MIAKSISTKSLGFSFTRGEKPKRRIGPKALKRLKKRIRELTRRTKMVGIRRMVEELSRYLRGWVNYFGFCETPSVLRNIDSWIRHRLRCVIWKQWKRGRVRYAELRKLGIGSDLAAMAASSVYGPWRQSHSRAMHIAFPNAYFQSLDLISLAAMMKV